MDGWLFYAASADTTTAPLTSPNRTSLEDVISDAPDVGGVWLCKVLSCPVRRIYIYIILVLKVLLYSVKTVTRGCLGHEIYAFSRHVEGLVVHHRTLSDPVGPCRTIDPCDGGWFGDLR